MAVCDKWVALKILEFLFCVACLVAKRVSQDDEARLALLLQKLSREWSLLTSVTWDSVGGAFADAVYGGYVIITFGLILARMFQEIPKGRRILESFFLGIGMLFFIILGGLELASVDSIPNNLVVNAAVLGTLSLAVASLFLIDLMGPRVYTSAHHSQTDPIASPKSEKKVSIAAHPTVNGQLPNDKQQVSAERPKNLDLEKGKSEKLQKKEFELFQQPKNSYTKFDDTSPAKDDLEASKFGSLRNDIEGENYVRLAEPFLSEAEKLRYEQELAKFNERYFRDYLLFDAIEGKLRVKENYLPEPQTPVFTKVKTGRLKSLYDDLSPSYEQKRLSKSPTRVKTVPTPTLQQLEDYLHVSMKSKRGESAVFPMEPIKEKDGDGIDTDGRASGTPTDPGYVQYAAERWPDKRDLRTPRHSPTK